MASKSDRVPNHETRQLDEILDGQSTIIRNQESTAEQMTEQMTELTSAVNQLSSRDQQLDRVHNQGTRERDEILDGQSTIIRNQESTAEQMTELTSAVNQLSSRDQQLGHQERQGPAAQTGIEADGQPTRGPTQDSQPETADDGQNKLSPVKLPTQGRSRDDQQETDDGGQKVSPADTLQSLWNVDLSFRDQFSRVLDVKYARSKYWPHLAEQFKIDRTTYEAFSSSDINSPTERLLEHLSATQPTYKVEDFCKDCKEADAHEVSRIVEESVKAGTLSNKDEMRKICNKDSKVLDVIVLKLDRESRLWQGLARKRGILQETFLLFQSGNTNDHARKFFSLLQTQGPKITIGDFKRKSKELGLELILETFKDNGISDDKMLLRDLSRNNPSAKSEIEVFLNNLKTDFLWRLAILYQKEGLMKDIDLEMEFRQQEDVHSPTHKMMEYVLTSLPRQHTIEELIIKLWNINRKDCFEILQPYLKGGKDDTNEIAKRLERHHGDERTRGEQKQPSTDDDRSASGMSASDQSDNKFVLNENT